MTEKPETQSEVSPLDANYWLCEIEAAKERLCAWYKKAEEAEDRYRDGEDDEDGEEFGALNILWANVETQKAAIGEDFGKPQVTRVNMPEDDDGLARQVALVWERTIAAAVKEGDDNHDIALAVGDVFLPGRGQVWLEVDKEEATAQREWAWIRSSLVRVTHLEYLEGYATRWRGVPWVGRRHFFTKDDLVSECKLSPEDAEKVPFNTTLPHKKKDEATSGGKGQEQFKRVEAWEVWTTYPQKARLYVACGYKDRVLCYDPDPLRLKHFFPCPRPLLANGDESKPPLTDYSRYQNQAEELDRICQRIFVLTESLQRKGIHDKSFEELADLSQMEENTSIAVENWADLMQKGGLNKVQEWLDLQPIVLVLVELHKQRDALIRLIYELSGISDLARGHTDPDETATAQQLKQTFGSTRFKKREKESRRFAAEAYALKGEVIAELFSREQIQEMSGIRLPLRAQIDEAKASLTQIMQQYQQAQQEAAAAAQQTGQQPQPVPPPDQEMIKGLTKLAQTRWSWEDISGVLRSDTRRCYSVEVETDQSNFIDAEAEKKARTEFFTTFMTAIQQIAPMIAGNPKAGEIFKQLTLFVIGAFKSGRAMEEGIERVIDEAIKKAAEQGQQPQQDPKVAADTQIAQARVQTAQVGLETAKVRLQIEQAHAQQAGADIAGETQVSQAKAAESLEKTRATITQTQAKTEESANKAVEAQQKVVAQHDANEAKRVNHLIDMQNRQEKLEFERETRANAEEALLKGETRKPQKEGAPT